MSFTGTRGLQHISKSLDDKDIESLQRMLVRVGRSLPDTTINHERKSMSEHKEMPGKGVLFFEPMEKRTSPKGPDYKGFVVLEMDYKAGEKLKIAAWQKPTSRGHNLLALKEDNWSKKKREEEMKDKEIPSNYARKPASRFSEDDSEIPF